MRGLGVLLLAALVVVPLAQAQAGPFPNHVTYCSKECAPSQVNDDDETNTPTRVILYAHLFDALQRAPLNVVPPDHGKEPDVNQGFLAPTVKVRENVLYLDNNWFYMFHMPSFVSYDGTNHDGPLAFPLSLVGDTAKLYWYLSPHAVPGGNSTGSPAGGVGVVPRLTVAARMETGRHALHGTLIAEGSTQAAVMLALPGGDYAYEFEVPLAIREHLVDPEAGFVVGINWFQHRGPEGEYSQGDWRIRSGLRFPSRLILPVGEPMRLLGSDSVYREGTHFVATELASVFGAYDINPFRLNLTFRRGPATLPDAQPLWFMVDEHRPVSVKVIWSVPLEGKVPAGTYEFELGASNLQGTYRLRANVTLDVVSFKAQSEGPDTAAKTGLVVGALALGAVGGLVAVRLRKRPV